ncbi:type IVB secretion system protein IcmV [Coxiella burnetii]|uniref:IcmV n=2 Tax=Coxiella burnetii TaxID=777 RepID=Q83B66_COXBU|nr:type IVB secretion system protein IcmV [Coxiella burnetii]NP_820631.2 Icm secretion system protein IcmV [Coxiella burnetii RSA 493]AAO91145.2 IcmV [Coxiella burnetii RSA 493]ABS76796.2 IcmV [Coxiella burnetii Dugway 5J108-111]ACJ20991.1 IcmV [Coxiella burnetii CbuK_Q154]AML48454.1 type IV secretion protein IcmV [Coxiella burnetii]AML54459.1 type IV secretion protein IcmV [Coxiella burnetii]
MKNPVMILLESSPMGFKNTVKKGFFSGLNPMRWVGYEHIASNAKTIRNIVDNIIEKPTAASSQKETFEECLRRFNLTEEDIKKRMKNALRIVIFCLALSFGMAGYTVYLFVHGLPLSAFVCVILTFVLWAYAFREHFNYFQMKQRRLGCTFKEWFTCTFKGSKQ